MKWLHLHWVDTSPQGFLLKSLHSRINDKEGLALVQNQTVEKQIKTSSYQD